MFVVNTDAEQSLSNFFTEKICFKCNINLTKILPFTELKITNITKIATKLTKIWHKGTKVSIYLVMNFTKDKSRLLSDLATIINITRYCDNFKFTWKHYVIFS